MMPKILAVMRLTTGELCIMPECIAAIDQGTTGTRCILFDPQGRALGAHYEEHQQIFPQPGWVEHDPMEILAKTGIVFQMAMSKAGIKPQDVAALGITNQRETVVVWDRFTGLPYHHAIVWQCTRSRELCQQLIDDGLESLVRAKTGLVIATYFSGPKIRWLLETVPGLAVAAEKGEALCGTIDTWLVWNLTGGPQGGVHVTDVTNASRTMLMNLETLDWDQELLDALLIPRRMLPRICPTSDPQAYGQAAPQSLLRARVPIGAAVGDQQAALVGQCCFAPGEAKNTYGTGSFMLMNTGQRPVPSPSGLLTTVAYQLVGQPCHYALEGSIAITGAAVQWLRDSLGLIQHAAETETVAATVPDSGGVYFVPAFSGLFAPHWDMYARGLLIGLTRFSNKAHLVRATLESICYQTRDVLAAMEADANIPFQSLKVDGGAVVNNLLMQLQADILGKPVIRPQVRETTALGAAYLAGIAAEVWPDLAQRSQQWQAERVFEPTWDEARRAQGYHEWKRAVSRARNWIEP
jgi:glycerol kinase